MGQVGSWDAAQLAAARGWRRRGGIGVGDGQTNQEVCREYAKHVAFPFQQTNKKNPTAKLKPHVKMPELQRATYHPLGCLNKAERR